MELKLQTNAWRGNEPNFYEGTILVTVEARHQEARWQFTLEHFDADSEGEQKPIFHVTEQGAAVFTPISLAGTTNALYNLCRAVADMAVDALQERIKHSTYRVTLFVPDSNKEEILNFLRDIPAENRHLVN